MIEEIDHAFGMLATPSISIGEALLFTALPSRQQLRSASEEGCPIIDRIEEDEL